MKPYSEDLDRLIICPKCATLHQKVCIEKGKKARCNHCGKELYHYDARILDHGLALGVTGLILFFVANLFPLVRVDVLGHEQHVTIISMVMSLFENEFYIVGIVVAFMVFIFPLMILLIYIFLSWLMRQRRGEHLTKELLILLSHLLPWSMVEIYLVSILVALVKLIGYMQIHFGLSFWALALFVLLDIYLTKSVHIGELWELRYRIFEMDTCQIGSLGDPLHQEIESADIVRCPVCEAVNLNSESQIECHRCASTIYQNPILSTSKAWAFLVTALILYVPANLYPILISEQFHTQEGNTIIGGIIVLWEEGSYPIALIILIASVLVPILKFIVLLYLLISNRRMKRYKQSKVNQHKLHYLTEVIGPWSMVDVFVVAVLTGLVQLTTVKVLAGPGATAFVLMVLFTMFAALSVDTRLFEERRENDPS